MKEALDIVIEFLKTQIAVSNPILGVVVGMLIIILESMIPMLPLAVFIAMNMLVYGNVVGFLISWVATILGCMLAFTLCRNFISKKMSNKLKSDSRIGKLINRFSKIKFSNLVLITALPFTPAFAINIAAGLSKITYKKFILVVMIAKLSVVYFWGFIGTTFLVSITNINVLMELGILLLIAYILSKAVMKKFNIE